MKGTARMTATAIYARKSPTAGFTADDYAESTDNQIRAIRRTLGDVGATVIYDDTNASAYSGKPRPAYDRMVADIQAGKVGRVAAWADDRLHRSPREFEAFLDLVIAHGVPVALVQGGEVDLSDADNQLKARIGVAIAQRESRRKSERLILKHASKAERGEFHGGRRRFGYNADMTEAHPTEAPVVRELVERVLRGESLHSLAKWLIAEGVPTAEGGAWTGSNLGVMLKRGHIAGLRTHKGETTEAAWPAIVDRAKWEAARAILTDPARRTSYSTARKYWLANIAECGVCGGKMRGRTATKPKADGTRWAAYQCETGGHVHKPVVETDEVVLGALGEWLADNDAAAIFNDGDEQERVRLAAEIDTLQARKREAVLMLTRANQPAELVALALGDMDTQINAAHAALAGLSRPSTVLDGLAGHEDAASRLAALTLDARREVVRVCPVTVKLMPAARRGAPFDPETVDMIWH